MTIAEHFSRLTSRSAPARAPRVRAGRPDLLRHLPPSDSALRFGLSALLGAVVGLAVAALDATIVLGLLDRLLGLPLWAKALAPGIGLALAALVLAAGRVGPSTSDEYIASFHEAKPLRARPLVTRLMAAVATLGFGGAGGLEGPSIYLGATFGDRLGARSERILGFMGRRALLAAGAAAGVAAIFKAPATGVLFALEAPYKRDVARHALLPALVSASAAYLVFAATAGAERLFPVRAAEVDFGHEVLGAVAMGLLAGITARAYAGLLHHAKEVAVRTPAWVRVGIAGLASAGLLVAVQAVTGEALTLGPSLERIAEYVLDPSTSLAALALLFAARAGATTATFAGGGVAGVFVPLAVQGLVLGGMVDAVFPGAPSGFYAAVGLSAVLGAGYRTPLAAVVFVAETTGRAEFVIPALIATALSQALMGEVSVSNAQESGRVGFLERRVQLQVAAVMDEALPTLTSTDPLTEVVDRFGADAPAPALPVVDAGGYCGLLVLRDVAMTLLVAGPDATVGDALTDTPAVPATAVVGEVAATMADLDVGLLVVVDADETPVGHVTPMSLTGMHTLWDEGPTLED